MSFLGKCLFSSSAHFKSGFSFVIIYMICKNFLPFHRLPFHFVALFLCCAEDFPLLFWLCHVAYGIFSSTQGSNLGPWKDSAESQLLDWQGIPCAEVFQFNLISLLILAFVVCVFGVIHIQKSLPRPLSKSFFPISF